MNLKNNIFYTHHGVCAKDRVAEGLVVESAHTRVKETVLRLLKWINEAKWKKKKNFAKQPKTIKNNP